MIEFMGQYIDKSALVAEIEKRFDEYSSSILRHYDACTEARASELGKILVILNPLEVKEVQEEPVSNDLEEAASQYPSIIWHISPQWKSEVEKVFKAGAQWQKENLWKPADGEDLPEIDREVIAIIQDENDAWITKVVFAHRPPKHWDGKNILTGEVTRYTPKTYDKGEWNMPNVKFWLDLELPKIE